MDLATLQKISTQILSREVPIYKRYLYSKIDFNSKLIGIKGARGAGKSTILLQYAKSLNYPISKILYVSCDHPAMSGVSLYDIAEHFMQEVENFLLLMKYIKMKIFQKI